MRSVNVLAPALITSLLGVRAAGQTPAPSSVAAQSMQRVAASFRSLESALANRDAAATRSAAAALSSSWSESEVLAPSKRANARATFDERVRSAQSIVRELGSAAASGDLGASARSAEDLRATCVRCHVEFRETSEGELSYPARRGAVAGVVRVRTAAGSERTDRSGVVVFLDGGPASSFAPPPKHPQISQRDRRFEPHVLPVLRGTTVDFPNDDVVYHNVFSLSVSQPFDLGIYRQGSSKSVQFTRSGLVRVYCHLHPQMATSIVVLDNPYFTLTDASGSFALPEVADGDYQLRTWSEFGGEARETVQVRAGKLLSRALTFQESSVQLEHKNKFGQPYREKY